MREGVSPLKAIRLKCLDCSSTSKMVRYCPADGVHSTCCPLWPFRFGKRPSTARRLYGPDMLDPKAMPDANVPVEELA